MGLLLLSFLLLLFWLLLLCLFLLLLLFLFLVFCCRRRCCCCCCCCCYVFWELRAWKCSICDEMLRHVTMSFNLGHCHVGPRHIRGFPVRRDAKWGHMRLGGGEAPPEQCMRGPIHGAPLRR